MLMRKLQWEGVSLLPVTEKIKLGTKMGSKSDWTEQWTITGDVAKKVNFF